MSAPQVSRISPAFWIALAFVLCGIPFLNKTGIHFDAAYEIGTLYSCCPPGVNLELGGFTIPIMILPYLGAFKTWLFQPILRYLEVTPVVLRLPTLIVGAASIYLTFQILDRISGRRAAFAGSLLLATDATFLISTTYDFGPIAFLVFFLLAAISLLLRFERTGSILFLAAAFFLLGVALWHKALFIWMLSSAAVALVLVAWRKIRPMLSLRNLAVALTSFCLGALPLIYYNIVTHGATFDIGRVMSGDAPMSQKVRILRRSVDSSVIFGFISEEGYPGTEVAPRRLGSKVSVAVARLTGDVRANWMFYCLLAALCMLPWLWFTPARGASMFVAIYLALAWFQMIVSPNTGATMHHVILLWPFPHFLIAIAGAQASLRLGRYGKTAGAALLGLAVLSNGLVINQFHADLTTRGTSVLWSDAVYPLFRYLYSLEEGQEIIATDWGYSTTLCVLSDGEIPDHDLSYSLLQPSADETAWIGSLMGDPNRLFVDHTAAGQVFPGIRERLDSIAAQGNYVREIVHTVVDRNRRPRFEVFRYRAAGARTNSAPAQLPTR